MRATINTGEKPSNTAYGLLTLLSIAVFWRTESVITAVLVGAVGLAALYGQSLGVWLTVWEWARPFLVQAWFAVMGLFDGCEAEAEIADPYEICVGRVLESKQYLYATLQELGSFLVFAITGGGKTSFLHSIVHQLIMSNTPNELRLVIADLKEGLDFRIYQRLPHLDLPIATSVEEAAVQIEWLKKEMTRRADLYKIIPEDRICNSFQAYHQLGAEYGLPRLPWIVAIVDEFQNITLESDKATQGMTKLAKEGRAFGISLIASTQLPKADTVPTNFKSQFPSSFCGYLNKPSQYYKIVELEKDIWEPFHKAGKITGRFIANIAGEYLTVSSPYIPERQLEKAAREWSNGRDEPNWPAMPETAVSAHARDWDSLGSADNKRAALLQWFVGKGERPSVEEFMAEFGAGRATYFNHVPKLWNEWQSNG